MTRNHKGFGIVEIALMVVVVAVAGFVSYKALDTLSKQKTPNTTQSAQVSTDQALTVTSASDLDKSAATLDATNIDGTEAAELNTETTF